MKHNKVVFPYPKKNIRVNFCVNSHENAFVLRDLRATKFFNFHMQYSSYMDVKKKHAKFSKYTQTHPKNFRCCFVIYCGCIREKSLIFISSLLFTVLYCWNFFFIYTIFFVHFKLKFFYTFGKKVCGNICFCAGIYSHIHALTSNLLIVCLQL